MLVDWKQIKFQLMTGYVSIYFLWSISELFCSLYIYSILCIQYNPKAFLSLLSGIVSSFDIMQDKLGEAPVGIFKQALDNIRPRYEVKSRRVGGATYQVPIEVRPERRTALAIKWLVMYARARSEKTMADRLASELLAAARGEGSTVKKKDDTHRMAEANKAFAHYRW